MGGDKCQICTSYLNIWDLFCRNDVLNFGIYTLIFSSIACYLLALKFVCKFTLNEPKCMARGMILQTLWIEGPNKGEPCQIPQVKKYQKRNILEADEPPQ